jgi:hypothetical protein
VKGRAGWDRRSGAAREAWCRYSSVHCSLSRICSTPTLRKLAQALKGDPAELVK